MIRGYLVEDAALDKKFRNLKCHYKTIKDNNKKTKTGQGRVCWEYFNIMDEIFDGDKTINIENILSSMAACTREQKENVEIETASNSNIQSNKGKFISKTIIYTYSLV